MINKRSVSLYIYTLPKHEAIKKQQESRNLHYTSSDMGRKIDKEKKLAELAKKGGPIPIPLDSYKVLFDILIERNAKFFTHEYGKSKLAFENYKKGKTDIYEDQDNNFPLVYELFNLKEEVNGKILKRPEPDCKKGKYSRVKMFSHSDGTESLDSLSQLLTTCGGQRDPFIYKLSDPLMLEKGITVDPEIVKPIKFYIFGTSLTNPEISWFTIPEETDTFFYPNKKLCAKRFGRSTQILYNQDGMKCISFLNGRLGQLIVVYSRRNKIFYKLEKPIPVAIFDLIGNGVVYDKDGNKRLIYDQAGGIFFDSPCKLPIKWKWKSYDQVVKRREELKFVKCNELLNHDTEEKMSFRPKRESKLIKRKTRRRQISKKTLSKIGSYFRSPRSKYYSEREQCIQKIDPNTPAILKFSDSGCRIEPLLAPCLEFLKHKPVVKPSGEDIKKIVSPFIPIKKAEKKKSTANFCFPIITQIEPSKYIIDPTHEEIAKPIVLKLSDNISLTIMSQKHIHIEFTCRPIHYIFNIGLSVDTNIVKDIYAVRNEQEVKEAIPCYFEVLKEKCKILQRICRHLKKVREMAKK